RFGEPLPVLLADHSGLEHGLVRGERRLDLERGHPHPVDLEHVVGTPAVVIIAVAVAHVLVAGVGPFADERAATLRAMIPVTLAGGGPTHHELADFAWGKLAPVLV